ncbi:hypothetical protein CEF21_06855 [Bacillus sp. FJAT-42376]|uniref:PCYCGC motif-containing (lipo)protein n=1 Tax=Bacillus sp. FJAT-42376 TaxID=2014076 RepID=UPI000F4D9F00|nr:PCYCGC motif-containing (lipo)protein [Bacillus sp. FJAT-42376]AZB42034.1 hypothetical protein CEF21_06855 [Bacillus sp. FJAT-42376]
MKIKLFIMCILSTLMLASCSAEPGSGIKEEAHAGHQEHASGDIREETKNVQAIPSFLEDKPKEMQGIYTAAAKHRELLESIPCYCGCGDSAGHRNNYDCFVFENKEDGSLVWDDHGTKCGVCMEIAAKSVADYQNGKSIKEIRSEIDQLYKEGYAKPTPTENV